ncbi:unnamed protein product [Spirodela intermedia]|uniref:aldehyde oxygenase (deformylating) n=1 Tax=Spirodela intermedia TaxID=51605 RepID=A0A7I8J9J4_SPIIN|nr:unnamed protein product [Spirodela intermedia]CAA6666122.1 unnamed protein product [Spirodela intermedia]
MACMCGVPVEVRATVIPIVIYWVYSGLYMALEYTGKYQLRRRQDGGDKNLASKRQMINPGCAASTNQPRLKIFGRLVAALLVMDTWQYFLHRLMHANSLLYRYSHSKHHRLVAPYAFGALYYHTPEGLLLNTAGGFVAMAVTGMPPCAAMVFFSLVAMRTVDIHCGMWVPWHPLNLLFSNNTAHHELHHQPDGSDFNFSQPFFVFWDRILGTQLPYTVGKAEGGGFDLKVTKKA